MDFLNGICAPEDIHYIGVGEFASSYIGEGYKIIYKEEEIDEYSEALWLCLVTDGESLADLALLERVLDRCKADEVFVILANSTSPERAKALKQKCSCILTLGSDDAETGVVPLMELVGHMYTDARLLELDTAELRALFDPVRTVAHHSLWYEDIDPQAFERDVRALELAEHAWPTMICILLPLSEDDMQLNELIAPLFGLIPQGGHRLVLWNVYRSELAHYGGMRVDIVRAKPALGTMQVLRDANKQLRTEQENEE